jgi:hypothetical protein
MSRQGMTGDKAKGTAFLWPDSDPLLLRTPYAGKAQLYNDDVITFSH